MVRLLGDMPADFRPSFAAVSCLTHDDIGQFLLLRRGAASRFPGVWGCPTGKVEPGEPHESAMIRELHEETGWKAEPGALEFIAGFGVRYPEFDFSYYLYRTKWPEARKPILCESEHDAFDWATRERVNQLPLVPGMPEVISWLDENRPDCVAPLGAAAGDK